MDYLREYANLALTDLGSREPKTLMELQVKLTEEVGELAAAVLHSKGLKKLEVEDAEEHVLEEASDVIIMSLSILSRFGFTLQDVEKMMGKKMAKWSDQVDQYEKENKIVD